MLKNVESFMQYRPFRNRAFGSNSKKVQINARCVCTHSTAPICPFDMVGLGFTFLLHCVWATTWGPIKLILGVSHVHKKWVLSLWSNILASSWWKHADTNIYIILAISWQISSITIFQYIRASPWYVPSFDICIYSKNNDSEKWHFVSILLVSWGTMHTFELDSIIILSL